MQLKTRIRSSYVLTAGWVVPFVLAGTFALAACDSGGGSEMENSPPTANTNSYAAAPAAKLAVRGPGVLEDDSDSDGDDLSVSTSPVNGPSNGSLTLNSDGSFEYTAEQGFTGDDQFTYEVTDGNGGTDEATVTIRVRDVDYAADIQPTFDSSCGAGQCHISQRTSGVLLSSKDQVLQSEGEQYGAPIIAQGDASRSASPIVDKILPGPSIGQRMPLTSSSLNETQIVAIRAWIEGLDPNR